MLSIEQCQPVHLNKIFETHELFDDQIINQWKKQISEHIKNNEIDGESLINTAKEEFSKILVDLYGTNIEEAANRTYDRFCKLVECISYDFYLAVEFVIFCTVY